MKKDSNIEYTKCPFCKSVVEVNVRFAKENGRIFCNSCCKAFDIMIEDDEPEEKPVEQIGRASCRERV